MVVFDKSGNHAGYADPSEMQCCGQVNGRGESFRRLYRSVDGSRWIVFTFFDPDPMKNGGAHLVC